MKDSTITSSDGDLSSTSFNDGVQIGINRTDKKEHLIYKYSKESSIAEAVLVDNKPMFLQVKDDAPILNEKIETDDLILVPPTKFQYLSNEYEFSSIEEIGIYIKRAENETLDSLYTTLKNVWKKYFDIDDETLTLCTADTIFTYFQDKLGMTHYLLFVGDNNSGKSNALRVFNNLGYRPLFDTSITPANIYNFLGRFEEGQGIVLEDEIDDIEKQPEKMRIYKVGYASGAKVTRMTGSSSVSSKYARQQSYNTFCFKAFSSEKQPDFSKAKGFAERIFTVKCSPGSPQHDISEITNDAGDLKSKKLFIEINDLRKLLLVYRIIHYPDPISDVDLSVKARDKQLCKPVIRLFKSTRAINEIINSLSRFLYEKNNSKINSFDSYLYSVVAGLVKDNGNRISNETLWNTVCKIPGYSIAGKPQSFQSEEYGQISKTQITKICEDRFGAHKNHDGEKRYLVFDKNKIENLKGNYCATKEIKILDDNNSSSILSDNDTSNTSNTVLYNDNIDVTNNNTSNTFCNDIEDTSKDTE